ncbi:uncharacterized protein DC041_0010782 [Schistosoma bovis]|uniref:Inversin n=1 Tax=Schistosoma bovis TaxID=6184 RepID=A0A430QKD5_SCHBO|nr:uncharacterized protein DC041_0010782 [Schistosoma bovis]
MISTPSSTINPNHEDKLKLLNACRQGDLDYLGKFIVDGGNLRNVIDNQTGQTTLHYCVKFGEEKIANEKDDKKPNGNDIQIFQRQLNRLKCTRVIIKSNPEFLTYYDHNGFTPIHLAVIHGDIDFLKVLNEFNNVDMKIKTKARSIMSSSSSTSHSDSSEINNTGRTIIHLCVIYSQLDVLNYLLTNSNNHNSIKEIVNEYDDQGATALHYSVQVNAEQIDELFELLINIGGANLNAPDTHGRTPIIWAATVGSAHAVEVLLKLGANLSHKDSHGLTALHCAASRGNLQTVQTILNWITIANKDDESKIALLRDVNDNDGCSPLFYSVATGHIHVTECFIKAGADVMHTDFKGRTVCHCLARLNSLSNGIKFDSLIKTQLTCLVEAGLNPWLANKTGLTALHEACLLRNVSFIKQLANLPGFNTVVNATESQGHTPLHLVVAASWSTEPSGIRLCHYLLEHEADVNAVTRLPNDEYVTPLNLAYLNETNDETSKNLLINLIKQYGGRTYQELSNEGKVSIDKFQSSGNDNTKIDIRTNGNHNDVNQEKMSASGVFNPENELKPIGKTDISSSMVVETIVGEKPQMIDSSTEPISEFIVSLTLKDSSVQTCLDRRRRKKLSTQSLPLLSSEEPMHETISTAHNRHVTDKSLNESLSVTSTGSSSSITLKNGSGRNGSSNHDNGQNTNTSIQLIVRVPTPSDLKLRNDKSSESRTMGTEKKNVPITLISTVKNNINVQNDNCHHFTSSGVDDKTPKNSKHLPYSQIYLEKELPLALKRYLEKENFNYSPLTGRSRLPKPSISPYLQPVVPGLPLYEENAAMSRKNNHNKHISRKQAQSAGVYNNNLSYSNNQQNKSISKMNTNIIHRKRFSSSASASNSSTMDVSIPGSYHTNKIIQKNIKYPQVRSQSSRNLHIPSNDNHEIQQSVADYEFYRFLNQLLKQNCPITQRKKKRATTPTTKTMSSKNKQSIDAYDDRHSAMGGELTPINNHRSEPNVDTETQAFSSKKSTSKQLNIK